jgi:glycosyltransferase involved in cell wall biosynthesis
MAAPVPPEVYRRLPATSIKILYPSLEGPHKGLAVLAEALHLLTRQRGDWTLLLTTNAQAWVDCDPAALALLEAPDLRPRVVFLGPVPNNSMGSLYRSVDLIVYPSLCESFGFGLLEALAHGRAVVAADTPFAREICGSAALYYSPLNAASACETLAAALLPESRKKLEALTARRLSEFPSGWDQYARDFEAIVSEAIRFTRVSGF